MTSRASKRQQETKDAVQNAGMLLKLSKKGGGMTAHSALRLAGVSTEDRANWNLQRRALRARDKLDDQRKDLATEFDHVRLEDNDMEDVRPFPDSQESVIPIAPQLPKTLKMRATSKQAAAKRKAAVQLKELRGKLFQEAVETLQEEAQKEEEFRTEGKAYKKKSAEIICQEINATELALAHDIKIVARTVRNAFQENRVTMQRRGGTIASCLFKTARK
ncbi:hypothetical protein SEMRO_964_G225450.1 [Seminavis robusta]|uniref:Uncharacterized protein n=1 Tax=Seminavis robusta TaxID=568900 RepID=A0A9N8EEL2_9STRA|nr:hypothetical protein SEMRO_964_G225450.1 [Seminavis robusta]|eukprot:Sro964_g225450.1 n/a (219) ;mRNA; f:15568-16279